MRFWTFYTTQVRHVVKNTAHILFTKFASIQLFLETVCGIYQNGLLFCIKLFIDCINILLKQAKGDVYDCYI